MQLTPELIDHSVENFPNQVIADAEEVTANHILFNNFHLLYPNYPKLIFYIVLDKKFEQSYLKDKDGNLGRKLKIVNPQHK